MKDSFQKITFLEAVTGLIAEPRSTVPALLSQKQPPYVLSILCCFLLVVLAPVLLHNWTPDTPLFELSATCVIALLLLCSSCIFIVLESILLLLLKVQFTARLLIAAIIYCCTPLMLSIVLVLLFNYFTNGELTAITWLLTGYTARDDHFLAVMPYALPIIQLLVFIVFFHCVRCIGQLYVFSAVLIAIISLVPLYLAVIFSIIIVSLVVPEKSYFFTQILTLSISM